KLAVRGGYLEFDVAQDRIDHLGAASRKGFGGSHVALEDRRKGRTIGDIEERQGADRHMQIDRIDILAEDACPLAPRQQIAQSVDGRNIEALDGLRTGNVSP